MTAEFEIFRKDLIKLNIYKEVVADKTVLLDFFLDGSAVGTDYSQDIHDENIVMNRYGCFNISEDKNSGSITIRPALVKLSLKISITCRQPFNDNKTLTVYRDGKTEAETSFDITNNCESIELIPENDKYIMKINYSENVSDTENTVNAQQAETPVQAANTVNNQQTETPIQTENIQPTAVQNTVQPVVETNNPPTPSVENKPENQNKSTGEIPQQKLDAIKTESEKDYEQYAEKLGTVKAEYEFDKSVIEYYKDHDLVPIEKIFAEIDEKLKSAEEQIKLFVEARQNKTKEIEE
ncbi:MAG: hypothetical protein PUG48_10075 [Clostridia bacterium]|nr:hypothetical protein [Clostridia bacterium]